MERQILKKIVEIETYKQLKENWYMDTFEAELHFRLHYDLLSKEIETIREIIKQAKIYNKIVCKDGTCYFFTKEKKCIDEFILNNKHLLTDFEKEQYITCGIETMPLKYFMESEE